MPIKTDNKMVCLLNGWSLLLLLLLVLRFAKGRVDIKFYHNMALHDPANSNAFKMLYTITMNSCVHVPDSLQFGHKRRRAHMYQVLFGV